MRFKNKGRKIYKTKEKNYYGKSPVGKAFSVGLTFLLVGGIGFLGYSVAGPLLKYSKKTGDSDVPQPTTMVTQPVTDEDNNPLNGEADSGLDNSALEPICGYALTVNDMVNRDILKAALKRIPEDKPIEYVEVPLKASGGRIYYMSNDFTAVHSGAVVCEMPLGEIASAIIQQGYKPMALVSIFDDNITPATFHDIGYTFAADGTQWLDNTPESGGKPWISPFSQTAVSYNINIINEISGSGFSKVVCSDFIFPEFRDSDIELIGDSVVSADRYMTLTSAANTFYDNITGKGSTMLLEVSAADILSGKCEIMQPMLLKVNTVVLTIDLDKIRFGVFTGDTVYEFSGTAAENVSKMLDLVSDSVSGLNVVAKITAQNYNQSDIDKAIDILAEHNINSYIIT